MLAGFIVLMIACLFQRNFGPEMKDYRPFSWEAFGIIFSVIGILLIPILWTGIEVPGFLRYILATPTWVLAIAAVCGFLWDISAIWYGKDIDSIGLSLTVDINTGVGCSLGSHPVIHPGQYPCRPFAYVATGMNGGDDRRGRHYHPRRYLKRSTVKA